MKLITAAAIILAAVLIASAQKPEDILATATGHTFRVSDLPADARNELAQMPVEIKRMRTAFLEHLLNMGALDAEARSLGISADALIQRETAKLPAPTEAEIKAIYDNNRSALGTLTLEQARNQIVAAVTRELQQEMFIKFYAALRTKHKAKVGKDINSPVLPPVSVVATLNGQPVTAREFEDAAKIDLYELRADYSDMLLARLDEIIYLALVDTEAKALKIDAGSLIAREITNRLKDFTDAEQYALRDAFTKRLFAKYKVKILYKEPQAPLQTISVDDDPSIGPVTAPVTIVMFSDFQCSACAYVHPILKEVIAQFPGKVRFVVRDFPLENVHQNAFIASLAAGAAHAQGKFFEYSELLYKRQDALDADSLKRYAEELGLNVSRFELDFKSAKTAAEVRKDMAQGESYSISSTPTVFVNGRRLRRLSADAFRRAIEQALGR